MTFDPILPHTLYRPSLGSTMGLTKVTVTPNLDNPRQYTISWNAQTNAVKYYVYASPVPTNRNKYTEVLSTTYSVVFETPIIVPDDIVWYFNVSYINPAGNEVFIQDWPVHVAINSAFTDNPLSVGTERDIIINGDALYFIEEIRRRHLAILEHDGEDFYLYIRRMAGQPCVCVEQDSTGTVTGRYTPQATTSYEQVGQTFDPKEPTTSETSQALNPGYYGPYRCDQCFGTRIAGGYFPKLSLRVRYGNMPKRIISQQEIGLNFEHTFNSHTLWHPLLKERDVLVRIRTGERFTVKEPSYSQWRGMVMHQEFNAVYDERTSMIYKINDERIQQALEIEGGFDIAKFNWAVWA